MNLFHVGNPSDVRTQRLCSVDLHQRKRVQRTGWICRVRAKLEDTAMSALRVDVVFVLIRNERQWRLFLFGTATDYWGADLHGRRVIRKLLLAIVFVNKMHYAKS